MPLPFILLGLAIFAGVLIVSGTFEGFNSNDKEKIKIITLDPKVSGKTVIHNIIRGTKISEKHEGYGLGVELEEETISRIKPSGEKQKITLTKVIDIGGSKGNITQHYANMIKDSDYIVFVASTDKLIESSSYVKDVRARINFINKKVREMKQESTQLIIVLSFLDISVIKYGMNEDIVAELANKKISDIYGEFPNKGTAIIAANLMNEKKQEEIKEVLFS